MASTLTHRRISLQALDSGNTVIVCQEALPGGIHSFSVTISEGTDEDWGEFISKEDAALLWFWLGKKLQEMV